MRRFGLLACILLGAGLSGCAGARFVEMEGNSGVVAIPRDTPTYREQADALMASRCPSGYAVDREREAVIGSTSRREIQRFPDAIGERWESRRTVRTETEWRIHFRCK